MFLNTKLLDVSPITSKRELVLKQLKLKNISELLCHTALPLVLVTKRDVVHAVQHPAQRHEGVDAVVAQADLRDVPAGDGTLRQAPDGDCAVHFDLSDQGRV